MPSPLLGHPLQVLNSMHAELTAFRRDLHAHPELGFEELRTAGLVAKSLELLGLQAHTGIGKTGVVAVIEGQRTDSGKSIGLRADMDALPMQEDSTFAHRSTKAGLMHGCGHDGHTTMLLGAAKYLAQTRRFNGRVVLIFQPGEEGYAGAKAMIEDGLFDRFNCDSVYAMHNWPALEPGMIGINPGPMMAAADRITIKITGRGGHGAHPYIAIDPVVCAAQMISAAQTIVSRNVNPIDSAVLSICAMQAGSLDAMSVIPGQATLVGTVRTFKPEVQALIERRLNELVQGIAAACGCTAELSYQKLYPATINTAPEAHFAADVATELFGADKVNRALPPSMGAEDFSFMLQAKPGAYLRIGQGGAESGCFLHNTKYDFNDAIIPAGSALFASLAERYMPLEAT